MRKFGAFIMSVMLMYFCIMSFLTLINEGVEVSVAFVLTAIALVLWVIGFTVAVRGDEL